MSFTTVIPGDQQSSSILDVEDFRRLGVRPFECRQTVIRLAALRSSRPLAKQQLSVPTKPGSLHLSRVMTSAYRLLDPRQREDPFQRAIVGRIMPDVLDAVAQTPFVSGLSEVRSTTAPIDVADVEDRDEHDLSGETQPHLRWTISLSDRDLVRRNSIVARIRHGHRRAPTKRAKSNRSIYVWTTLLAAGLATAGLEMLPTVRRSDQVAPNQSAIGSMLEQEDSQTGVSATEFDLVPPEPKALETLPTMRPGNANRTPTPPVMVSPSLFDSDSDDSPVVKLAPMIEMKRLDSVAPEPPLRSEIQEPEPVRIFAVPSDDDVAAAHRNLVSQLNVLSESVDIDSIAQRVSEIDAFTTQKTVGSPEHWAGMLVIAQHAWLVDDVSQIENRLTRLADQYRFSVSRVLATTFIQSCSLARMPETHEHLFSNGLRLCDYLLVNESSEQCQQVVESLSQILPKISSDGRSERLENYGESIEQMERLSAATNRWVQQVDKSTPTKDTGIAGRYYCLMIRKWTTGLPWLVELSDKRIARVAQQELAIDGVQAQIVVANRWLDIADRYDGRVSNSIRLHGIELLRESMDQVTAIQRLEIERKIEETQRLLPADLRLDIGEQPSSTSNLTADPKDVDNQATGLTGRITIDGKDVGVRVNYQLGAIINQTVLDTILHRLDRVGQQVSIQFSGIFELQQETRVSITSAAIKGQELRVDGELVAIDPLNQEVELTIQAGTRTITWTVEADRIESLFLRLQETDTGRSLPVVYQEVLEGLPTQLTVNVTESNDSRRD